MSASENRLLASHPVGSKNRLWMCTWCPNQGSGKSKCESIFGGTVAACAGTAASKPPAIKIALPSPAPSTRKRFTVNKVRLLAVG